MSTRPIRRNPESTAHQYVATVEWTHPQTGQKKTAHWSGLFSRSHLALQHLHQHFQRHAEPDGDRKIVRPKLRHDQYRISTFEIVYNGEVSKAARETEYRDKVEIPAGAYPDLHEKREKPLPTAEFGFVADLPSDRPASEPVFGGEL